MANQHHGFSLAATGHVAQVAGFYKTGHLIRAASSIGVGSSMGVGATLAVVPGLIALSGAVAAVAVGFKTLEETTMSLVGAIAQLGGARGLQSMLVEAVTNDKLANQARFSVSGDERLTKSDLMSLASSLSENASAGAFTQEDWLKTVKNIGTITGQQKGLDKGTLEFLGQFANVGGTGIEATGDIFGHLKAQNKSLSNQDIRDIMLAGHAIGQSGSFNISEIPTATKLMQLKGSLGGMSSADKYQNLFTVGSLVKEGGAGSLETAGVQYQAFLRQAELAATKGHDKNFQFNQAHQLLNATEALEYVVNTESSKQSKYLTAGRSRNFESNLSSQVSERAGVDKADFSSEAVAARKKVIEDLLETGMSLEEFQKEVEGSITPQEHFRAAFNKIANNLEAQFLPVMKQLEPVIDQLATKIVSKKEEIGDFFTKLTLWMAVAIEKIPALINLLGSLASAIGKVVVFILSHTPGSHFTASEDQAKKNLENAYHRQRLDELYPVSKDPAMEAKEKADIQQQIEDALSNIDILDAKNKFSLKSMAQSAKDMSDKENHDKEAAIHAKNREAREYGDKNFADFADKANSNANDNHAEIMDMHQKTLKVHQQMVHHLTPQAPTPPSASKEGY